MALRIVFLCSSLEPGRDGVGDYVRRLGGMLIYQGHSVTAIALNDPYLMNEWAGVQMTENNALSVHRIPADWSSRRRFKQAKYWVDTISPDWISLQYVPYGFQKKGLPFGLSYFLKPLGKNRHWHIMFHELWVGMDEHSSLKLVFLGWLQQKLIKSLVNYLKPAIVHTQTRLYQLQLRKLNIDSSYLPLPSNIPIHFNEDYSITKEIIENLIFVIFGSIHTSSPIDEFANEVSLFAKQKSITAGLILIGRIKNTEQQSWVTSWKKLGLSVYTLGEQRPNYISQVLQRATYGITTTPFLLAEKSGSVAAMHEHGLPVICVSRSWQPRAIENIEAPSNIIEYLPGNLSICLQKNNCMASRISISQVALQLIDNLSSSL